MNGHVYWRDQSNATGPLPTGAQSMVVSTGIVDEIRERLNSTLGAEMVNFCILAERTQATGWA
jgi:hypothetical protein